MDPGPAYALGNLVSCLAPQGAVALNLCKMVSLGCTGMAAVPQQLAVCPGPTADSGAPVNRLLTSSACICR